MSKLIVNIGATANDKTGDTIRAAFDKVNQNFTELYATTSADVQIPTQSNNGGKYLTTNGTTLSWGTVTQGAGDRLVNGSLEAILDASGTINTPLFFPKTFTALLLPVYGGGTDGPYGGNAWEIGVTFDADADGTVSTLVDNIFPILNNPGYKNGDSWTFHEADHGIPGYTFTLALGNVVYPGGAGWTANVLASEPPEYTPTVKSLGAIKLTSNGHSIVLGTDGYLTMESLYLQGYLKGVDGNTGSTGQVLTRQSNGGVAWADSTGGGTTLPTNAAGALVNNGSGTLTWTPFPTDGTGLVYGSRLVFVDGNGSDLVFQTESIGWGKVTANNTDGFGLKASNDIKIHTQRPVTTDVIIANGSEFTTDVLLNGSILPGWYQRNPQQIEFALFVTPAPVWVLLTQLALGRTVIVTYSTASGNQTFTGVVSQQFTATGQTDPNTNGERYSGRIDGTLPVDQTGIVSINFPEYSTQDSVWTFGTDGTLNLPDSVSAGNAIIQTTSPINIQVNSNAHVWTFGTDGKLTAPGSLEVDGGKIILHPYGASYIESVDYGVNSANSALNIFAGPDQKIKLRAGFGTEAFWTFGTDGNLTFPDSTVQTTAWTGTDTVTLNAVQTLTNKTLTSPTITDGVFQHTFSIGNQVFYEHGYNGFSVNEDFDIVGEGNFTGYHYTSGAGRDGVAFTLARTGQFTTGFGIHGTAEANEYVIGSETTNTDFVFKKSIGMPFDVSGGTDLFRISNDGSVTFSDATVQTTAYRVMSLPPLTAWGTVVSFDNLSFSFDATTGSPGFNGGYGQGSGSYSTLIWTADLYQQLASPTNSTISSGEPVQYFNYNGPNLITEVALTPGDSFVLRIQDVDTNRVYRATFLASFKAADAGNEGKYGAITVERLV